MPLIKPVVGVGGKRPRGRPPKVQPVQLSSPIVHTGPQTIIIPPSLQIDSMPKKPASNVSQQHTLLNQSEASNADLTQISSNDNAENTAMAVGDNVDIAQKVLSKLEQLTKEDLDKLGVRIFPFTDGKMPTDLPDGSMIITDLTGKAVNQNTQEHDTPVKPKRKTIKIEPELNPSPKPPNLPVFTNEEDKAKFEQALLVDLSMVDNLFYTHVISQDMNESAQQVAASNRVPDSLSVFSCTRCQRVFMSLSHARHHCLIHTDLKPFQCFLCDYATNSKGRCND